MTGPDLWESASWHAEATTWLDERLAAAGRARRGPVERVRVRSWGAVLRADTDQGPVWLKAPGPGTVFEVGLYPVLHRYAPDRVLPPIAADPARGLLLLPDGGPTLTDAAALPAILPRYGELQRDLAPHTGALLAAGVTDMRPHVMPARFDEALAAMRTYATIHGAEADHALCDRIAALRPDYVAWCERLAALPGGAGLDHNDLHQFNVFADGTRFYDWGDSVLAHPFAVLLVPLSVLRDAGLPVEAARDGYLAAFADLAPHPVLVEAAELACRVGKVARALVWDRAVRSGGYRAAGEFARAPLDTLAGLLLPGHLDVAG